MALETHEDTRLRKVEEAIIEFSNIAKTVIVDLKDRVRILEKSDAGMEDKIINAMDKVSKTFGWVIAGLFALFCGALLYFNAQVVHLNAEITEVRVESLTNDSVIHEGTIKNNVKLDTIIATLEDMKEDK